MGGPHVKKVPFDARHFRPPVVSEQMQRVEEFLDAFRRRSRLSLSTSSLRNLQEADEAACATLGNLNSQGQVLNKTKRTNEEIQRCLQNIRKDIKEMELKETRCGYLAFHSKMCFTGCFKWCIGAPVRCLCPSMLPKNHTELQRQMARKARAIEVKRRTEKAAQGDAELSGFIKRTSECIGTWDEGHAAPLRRSVELDPIRKSLRPSKFLTELKLNAIAMGHELDKQDEAVEDLRRSMRLSTIEDNLKIADRLNVKETSDASSFTVI